MDAVAFGSVLIPLPRLYALFIALCLLGASSILSGLSRRQHMRWFSGLILVWLISARLGHVALNPDSYATSSLDALRFWLPGFSTSTGLAGTLVWSAWVLRDRLGVMVGAAGLCILASLMWLTLAYLAPFSNTLTMRQLPELTLHDLDGNSVVLSELQDQQLIINLWHSACTPCQRALPLLAEVDARDDASVVLINQGEDLLPVMRYLDSKRLVFRQALLDPRQRMMVHSKAAGLPATLLLDSKSRVRHRHIGELGRATLNTWLAPSE